MLRSCDEFDTVLKTLASDHTTEFGMSGARVEVLHTVDGPFSRVRRVRIHTPGRISHAYIKIFKRRDGEKEMACVGRMLEREYRATLALHETLRQDEEFGAVRPLAWLPEHRALITQEVPGRPLGELLVEAVDITDELLLIASRVGKWVHVYQGTAKTANVACVDECRRYLDVRLQLLEHRVISPEDRGTTLQRFDALAEQIGSSSLRAVPIHADFTPMNLIVGQGGRVTVLDFTMAKTGTVHHDLSHAFFHLELLAVRYRARRALFRAVQSAMLNGYDPTLSATDPLFRMMLLQHCVCHVALLAERRLPLMDRAYRWFLRRRWQVCEQILEQPPVLRVA